MCERVLEVLAPAKLNAGLFVYEADERDACMSVIDDTREMTTCAIKGRGGGLNANLHPVVTCMLSLGIFQRIRLYTGRESSNYVLPLPPNSIECAKGVLSVHYEPSFIGLGDVPDGMDNIAIRAAQQFCSRFAKLKRSIELKKEAGPGNTDTQRQENIGAKLSTQCSKNIEIRISKSIPVAAGLAGGSADAAGVLVALNTYFQNPFSLEELLHIASMLGSDVPFCTLSCFVLNEGSRKCADGADAGRQCTPEGSPALARVMKQVCAIGYGFGERLERFDIGKGFPWVVFCFNGRGLSTKFVYAKFDEMCKEARAHYAQECEVAEFLTQLRRFAVMALSEDIVNDRNNRQEEMCALEFAKILNQYSQNSLQNAAIELMPEIERILEAGEVSGALFSTVCGSGSSVAFLLSSSSARKEFGLKFRERLADLGYCEEDYKLFCPAA